MGGVGGNPDVIATGGAQLHTAARALAAAERPIAAAGDGAAASCPGTPVAEPVAAFASVYARLVRDVGIELTALATLATNTGADLATAGGRPGTAPR